jgi:hypothetical protein
MVTKLVEDFTSRVGRVYIAKVCRIAIPSMGVRPLQDLRRCCNASYCARTQTDYHSGRGIGLRVLVRELLTGRSTVDLRRSKAWTGPIRSPYQAKETSS